MASRIPVMTAGGTVPTKARKPSFGAGTRGVVGLGSGGCLIFLPRSANEVPPCRLDQ